MAIKLQKEQYIRVGIDYFKIITKTDRFGIKREELKKWNKHEIKQDYGTEYLKALPKYDDFTIIPDNNGVERAIDGCYNMFNPMPYKPKKGKWQWTEALLKQVFGSQYEAGLIYLQVLYLWPKQALPVLVLVSKERSTGKSTFLDWLNAIFGANVAMVEPETIGSTFNSEYAGANLICIDETILDKQMAVERIKSLATRKFITVNIKNVQQFKIPFFGKIIMASNMEDKFMRIDEDEIRFWVRKLGTPTTVNHNILNDAVAEIPAFLHHLQGMPMPDFETSRMVLTKAQIQNAWLDKVVQESRSGLYKEICEHFTELFNQYETENTTFYFTPGDIKQRFFNHNNNIGINYIRRVLKTEFNLETAEMQRFKVLDTQDEKPGTPFYFCKEQFTPGGTFLHGVEALQPADSAGEEMPF